MTKVFELFDATSGGTISYHKTLKGALEATAAFIKAETPGLVAAFGEDECIKVTLKYAIKSIPLQE